MHCPCTLLLIEANSRERTTVSSGSKKRLTGSGSSSGDKGGEEHDNDGEL